MSDEYDVYSEFDLKKHNENYICYLEVIIHPCGKIEYAIPSHQIKLLNILKDMSGKTLDEIVSDCPEQYKWDFLTYLVNKTGCISVWYEHAKFPEKITRKQQIALQGLRISGAYAGNTKNNNTFYINEY